MKSIDQNVQSNTREPAKDSQSRSIIKALTWRITGSIDTIVLAFLFIGDISVAASIGIAEVFTKMILYYFHERAWNRVSLGKQ